MRRIVDLLAASPFVPRVVPLSATRSVQDLLAGRESSPGASPAPHSSTAAGWAPVLPPELREPPCAVTPAAGPRERAADRRFTDRRIRDDGSPYGVERRSGAETRLGDRRTAADLPPRLARSGLRGAHAHDADYVPHLPDLLARFHGR